MEAIIMNYLGNLISVHYIIFNVWGYSMSFIEFFGTLFGLVSVLLATRLNILTWSLGIVNQLAFFLLFYQIQFYFHMLLQVTFAILCTYGWIHWKMRRESQAMVIWTLREKQRLIWMIGIAVAVIVWGTVMAHIHNFLPDLFPKAQVNPYIDAFTAVGSIAACFLMARKTVEAWVLWVLVDIVNILFYAFKGMYFITAEYGIFLVIARYGLMEWIKEFNQYKLTFNRSKEWWIMDYYVRNSFMK